nr:hypothetical protein [Tanacetum cinerariifolium]
MSNRLLKSGDGARSGFGKYRSFTKKKEIEDDDNADDEDDNGQDDDNEQTRSDNDGDDFVHPKLSTFDEEERPTQVVEDTHVIMTAVTPEAQQQSSYASSGFISNMLKLNPDICIDSILNLNTDSTSLVDVPVNTNVEMPPSSVTTLPPPPIPIAQPQHQTSVLTPAIVPNVSSIPGIVDTYLANKMNEAIKTVVQLHLDRLRDEAQAENEDFINKLGENIKKIIKEQVKVQVKEQVSKILQRIEKLVNDQLEVEVLTRSSNEAKTSHAKTLYKALIDAYETEKVILDTYGDTVTFKRCRDDEDDDEEPFAGSNRGSKRRRASKEPESSSAPKEKTSDSTGKSKEGSKSHQKSTRSFTKDQPVEEASRLPDWFQKLAKPPTPDRDWNKTLPAAHGPIQPWISNLARKEDTRDSFNELVDTPLDFSAFVMNRIKVDTLTPKLLAGQQYPHDLRKPLLFIPNSQGRRVIPYDHFINNDLAYLRGGASSRTYATSVMKTKAVEYGHIKWIEDLVPNTMWSLVPIVEWHNYKHSDCITVSRDDDKLYTFKEGGYKSLRLQDIEDMLPFLVQGKLTNLVIEDLAMNVSLRMFTRRIVIQRRVKDIQFGVESYQKKLNLTRSDTYRSDFKRLPTYSAYPNPIGFIYQNKDKKKLMCIDELYIFSDGTLNDVQTALEDILKRIRMKYLLQTYWRNVDKERA